MKNAFILTIAAALAGCGTMNVGTVQKISFSTNIDGVVIYDQDYQKVCTAPCTAELPRRANELFFVAKKPGYVNRPFRLNAKFESSFFRHFLTSGITSIVSSPATTTDLASGAAYEYEPNHVFINMIKTGSKADMQQQKEEADIRRYFLSNYDDIRADVAKGQGEKLDTLKDMTRTHDNEVAYVLEKNPGKEKAAIELIRIYRRNKTTTVLQDYETE